MPHCEILEAGRAVVVVVDVQSRMLDAIGSDDRTGLVERIARLVAGASVMGAPVLFTEQYPQGLGLTADALLDVLRGARGPIIKSTCSCWRDAGFRAALQETQREHVLLAGIESHVCIQQTALDLLRVDYVPFVAVDAIASRRASDKETAVARMQQAGVVVSTTEALLFELVERCDHPRFKDILRLIK